MKEEKEKNQPPVKTFNAGEINVAVWKNKTEATSDEPERTFHTITFERRYKDAEGQWKGTAQLRPRDLLPAAHLFRKAFDYLLSKKKDSDD